MIVILDHYRKLITYLDYRSQQGPYFHWQYVSTCIVIINVKAKLTIYLQMTVTDNNTQLLIVSF